MTTRTFPRYCPECGTSTADNITATPIKGRTTQPGRHCYRDDAEQWRKKCLTIRCVCGCVYAPHGHYRIEEDA